METPICDFVAAYAKSNTLRLHMPGHKGEGVLGAEALDITEIAGADALFEAEGIIRQSEQNAGALFGANSFYSTEGSSLSIRAMLYLTALYAKQRGRAPVVLATRNCHKSFVSATALVGLAVEWLFDRNTTYLSCPIDTKALEARFAKGNCPVALYVTSPDYLGHLQPIREIAKVCRAHDVLLLVDNAHGAYLKFLTPSQHPIDLGAAMCCDSAHKTLPVLTGGGYLHIAKDAPPLFAGEAKQAMALFASTSPSYLILQSLDHANRLLADGFSAALAAQVQALRAARQRLTAAGYCFVGEEEIKWTIAAKDYGYLGVELAALLRARGIECEFADPDFLVLMFGAFAKESRLEQLEAALMQIKRRTPITQAPPAFHLPQSKMSAREAVLCPAEQVSLDLAPGRVLARACCACPPAVPIVSCGEEIDEEVCAALAYYGITQLTVCL